jgi:hypothetical protein
VPGSLVGVIEAFDERLEMAFPVSLTRSGARRLEESRGPLVVHRLRALVQAPRLDAELSAGIRPSVSQVHQARADHLRRRRVRRRIATALNRAVEDAVHPVRHGTPQAPLDREAVLRCHREIRALATLVATAENPRTQGVAIVFQMAFDGRGALFFQPDTANGVERLANTVQAARSALSVSGDFE